MYLYGESAMDCAVAEQNNYRWTSKEAGLVAWWLSQSTQSLNLVTTGNERLIVIDAGQRNDGPGPDIKNCRLILDDREISGFVEMHLHGRDWFHHGHAGDPAYENVILHVVGDSRGGPDLSTLVVQEQFSAEKPCLARRPATVFELVSLAEQRFRRKVQHLEVLDQRAPDHQPLLQGMLEIILAGPQRHSQLHTVALKLGLSNWPEARIWQGSSQRFPVNNKLHSLADRIIINSPLFALELWEPGAFCNWHEWDQKLEPLHQLGISLNQGREWLINILAAHYGFHSGFELWLNLPVFRHYGLEKSMITNLGIAQVDRVFKQQALLEWREQFCLTASCRSCPLSQSHHSLD